MKNIESTAASGMWQDTVLNNSSLNAVKKMGREGDPKALREVANQFESMFIQQMFKSMRAATNVFSEDSYLNSSETELYQDMLDQQYSLNFSKGRGIGLAAAFYDQMMRNYGGQLNAPSNSTNNSTNNSINNEAKPTAQGLYIGLRTRNKHQAEASAPEAFVKEMRPYADWAAAELGISSDAIVAQAALETGWGKFVLRDAQGNSSHNMFNIKAPSNYGKNSLSAKVLEFSGGVEVQERAKFKKYSSVKESFSDYVNFMQQSRYQKTLGARNNTVSFAKELQSAGFATDPNYANKLQAILQGPYLQATGSKVVPMKQGEA